jgi:hypothetical protein
MMTRKENQFKKVSLNIRATDFSDVTLCNYTVSEVLLPSSSRRMEMDLPCFSGAMH